MRKLFAIASLLIAASSAQAAEKITLVADRWCPYNCDQEGDKQGYVVDIAKAVFAKENIEVEYKIIPWAQALQKVKAGDYSGLVGASRGDCEECIFPDILQGISLNKFWVRKDSNWQYTNTASLVGKRLGLIEGYSYGKVIDNYLKQNASATNDNIQLIKDVFATELNIYKLLDGRVDAILEDRNAVEYYFYSRGQEFPFKLAGNPVDKENIDDTFIYIAFSPKNARSAEYAAMLTRGIQEMRRTGELRTILSKYNMDDSYRFFSKNPQQF